MQNKIIIPAGKLAMDDAALKAKSRSYQCLDERQRDRLPVRYLVL